jgi:hypothetical protein
MGSAVLQLPEQGSANDRRRVLRAAIRQLERAEIYLDAVDYMDLGEWAAQRALTKLRADLVALRDHLAESRTGIRP